MNLYLLFIIGISLFGIKFFFRDFNENYLSKESTSCIKGIFILIVFYSHLETYTTMIPSKDSLMWSVRIFLGQLMVTLFLFYSGYGVYESIKKKKKKYIDSIPMKRIFITLLNFDIAVLTFLIVNYFLGTTFPIKRILLSLIGWNSVGNSNWYIFGILGLYLITYLAFQFFDNNKKAALVLTWVLTLFFILFLSKYKPAYCYTTLLCYPFGMTYSYYKDKIEKTLFNNKKYILACIISFFAFYVFRLFRTNGWFYFECMSIMFCILVVLFTMKANINNCFLKWCGDNLFWFYILQRIPMLVLKSIGYNNHAYRFAFLCFVISIIITFIYSKIMKFVNEKIIFFYNKKEKE